MTSEPEGTLSDALVAGRARDYEAVAAVVNARGDDLDARYVGRKLEGLGMTDRWDRALEEAEREAESPD